MIVTILLTVNKLKNSLRLFTETLSILVVYVLTMHPNIFGSTGCLNGKPSGSILYSFSNVGIRYLRSSSGRKCLRNGCRTVELKEECVELVEHEGGFMSSIFGVAVMFGFVSGICAS